MPLPHRLRAQRLVIIAIIVPAVAVGALPAGHAGLGAAVPGAVTVLTASGIAALCAWRQAGRDAAGLAGRLARQREELQLLAGRLMRVQENERASLSRELHDDIGQAITAIKLGASSLQHEPDPPRRVVVVETAHEIAGIADQTVAKLRDLSLLLRPPQLDALGSMPHCGGRPARCSAPTHPSLGWISPAPLPPATRRRTGVLPHCTGSADQRATPRPRAARAGGAPLRRDPAAPAHRGRRVRGRARSLPGARPADDA